TGMHHLIGLAPVEPAAQERLLRVGVGNGVTQRGILELAEALELATPSIAHRNGQLVVEVAEEQEGSFAGPFLAHEEEWWGRGEQRQRDHRFESIGRRDRAQPLAEGAVADLVVVLQELHESTRR